jgi:hypothetical protein
MNPSLAISHQLEISTGRAAGLALFAKYIGYGILRVLGLFVYPALALAVRRLVRQLTVTNLDGLSETELFELAKNLRVLRNALSAERRPRFPGVKSLEESAVEIEDILEGICLALDRQFREIVDNSVSDLLSHHAAPAGVR